MKNNDYNIVKREYKALKTNLRRIFSMKKGKSIKKEKDVQGSRANKAGKKLEEMVAAEFMKSFFLCEKVFRMLELNAVPSR